MRFTDISDDIDIEKKMISADSANEIERISLSSKDAGADSIFAAIRGFKTDGHKFIDDAYKRGCRDFLISDEKSANCELLKDSTVISVADTRRAFAAISVSLAGHPSGKLRMIGITGTKGKTTVSTLLHHIITAKQKAGLFTTIKNICGGTETDSVRTTMESNELQSALKRCLESGEKTAVVEVSSHALTLDRVFGIDWDACIFTSFSRDHLDLYGTMEKYFDAKLELFKNLISSPKKNKMAFINIDDPKGDEIVKLLDDKIKVIKVGRRMDADHLIHRYEMSEKGNTIVIKNGKKELSFFSPMRGEFNVMNTALAAAYALESGMDAQAINARLAGFKGVEGRFEIIIDDPFCIVIDYAHTPDSLERILVEGRNMAEKRVICVFGCTGERDREKRSLMGNIAGTNCDFCIVTNDDTYDEDPESIAKEVERGLKDAKRIEGMDYKVILDRKAAIARALDLAIPGDVIIIAGMGHEKQQILKDGPVPYNDKDAVMEQLKDKGII